MKKEIFLAVLVGLCLGLIITYGVYRARKSDVDLAHQATTAASTPTPTPEETLLVIHSPEDEIITDQETVSVAGTTTPQAFVVIFTNGEEQIIQADDSGNFSVEAKLETGSNIITVHSLDEDGKSTQSELTLIYTTQPLVDDTSPDKTATESGTTSKDNGDNNEG